MEVEREKSCSLYSGCNAHSHFGAGSPSQAFGLAPAMAELGWWASGLVHLSAPDPLCHCRLLDQGLVGVMELLGFVVDACRKMLLNGRTE